MEKSLRDRLKNCEKCPLYATLMVSPNLGLGSLKPDIMFILNGVDRDALILNKPLNEIAETVLLTCLSKTKISPKQCYVTSIIKCGSLKDKKSYVDTCVDWLMEEINTLQPKVLFFLGRKTHETFLRKYNPNIKTYIEETTLNGLFSRSSLMAGFIEKLKLVERDICHSHST
jgi:uracil-DNA glycosylase family 4